MFAFENFGTFGEEAVRLIRLATSSIIVIIAWWSALQGGSGGAAKAAEASEPLLGVSLAGLSRSDNGVACVQDALGGLRALAAVSSLQIIGHTRPAASSGPRPIPGKREITIVFPDRYLRVDGGRSGSLDPGMLGTAVGFDGSTLLSRPRVPDLGAAIRSAKMDFVREMLARLPRASKEVQLTSQAASDGGQERLEIVATGPGGAITLMFAESRTCMPLAVAYEVNSLTRVRVDLSKYAVFGGIRFPTFLRTSFNGQAFLEEEVSEVRVNPAGASEVFAARR